MSHPEKMERENTGKRKLELDKPVFFAASVMMFVPIIGLMILGQEGKEALNAIRIYLTREWGVIYLIMGLLCIIFCLYVAFSKYGKLKLGPADEKPEYKPFIWAAMMFSMGIAASIFWAACSEWVYYIKNPPFGIEPFSERALDIAPALSIFHWGPTIWAIYTVAAITVAYVYHIRDKPELKISPAVALAYEGNKYTVTFNRIVDVLIIVGVMLSAATGLGLGTPFVSAGISVLTGIPEGVPLRMGVLAIVVAIYSISSTVGLQKGMALLSNTNVKIMFCLCGFIFVVGPTTMILQSFLTTTGLLFTEFITWSTWMEPNTTTSTFHADWPSFYWAWAAAAGLISGAFIARVSRGYTLKTMILGCLVFGTLGNSVIIWTFTNFGINLYRTGKFDSIAEFANSSNLNLTVMTMFSEHLPFSTPFLILLIFSCIVFMATSFDAFSFSLGAFTTKEIRPDEEPAKWNKMYWALMMGAIPVFVILARGDLTTIQSTAILSGSMATVMLFMMMYGFLKAVHGRDHVFCLRKLKEQEKVDHERFKERFGVDDVDDTVA